MEGEEFSAWPLIGPRNRSGTEVSHRQLRKVKVHIRCTTQFLQGTDILCSSCDPLGKQSQRTNLNACGVPKVIISGQNRQPFAFS
jgi:hypothetical protein